MFCGRMDIRWVQAQERELPLPLEEGDRVVGLSAREVAAVLRRTALGLGAPT